MQFYFYYIQNVIILTENIFRKYLISRKYKHIVDYAKEILYIPIYVSSFALQIHNIKIV